MSRPCMEEPEDVCTKSIGLGRCHNCNATGCWIHYLRWEVSRNIDLNKASHWRTGEHCYECGDLLDAGQCSNGSCEQGREDIGIK